MIQIVTGKLGSGKTLYSVSCLSETLAKGRTVVSNIEIDWLELCRYARRKYRVILSPDQLVYLDPEETRAWETVIPFGTRADPVEVYLDEIHLFYNARDWQKTGADSKDLLSFLTQSRKASVNITFIAQEIETIEKQFRVQAEWELYVQSSDHLPLGILGMCPFKFFMILHRSAKTGAVVRRSYRNYDKRLFKVYNSLSFLDSRMRGISSRAVKVQGRKLPRVSLFRWLLEFLRPYSPPVPAPSSSCESS